MKRAMTRLSIGLALSAFSLACWGFDIGGAIDNNSSGNTLFTPSVNLSQSDKLTLWMSHNFDDDISDNALEVYMHRLRKKLDHSDISIRTIRGLGYMLENNA